MTYCTFFVLCTFLPSLLCFKNFPHLLLNYLFWQRNSHKTRRALPCTAQLQKLLASHTIVTHLSFARNVFEGCVFTVRKGLLGYCMQLLPGAMVSVAVQLHVQCEARLLVLPSSLVFYPCSCWIWKTWHVEVLIWYQMKGSTELA